MNPPYKSGVARCLRETGRFVDEEGEATNALDDLLSRIDADGVPEAGKTVDGGM